MLEDPSQKVFEIGVETFKGVVQLSGFVNSSQSHSHTLTANASEVRRMKPIVLLGIMLIVLGVVALAYQGIIYAVEIALDRIDYVYYCTRTVG